MRFLTLVQGSAGAGKPPKALMDAVAKLGEEETRRGRLIETGGLYAGTRVRLAGGKVTVTDGPFTETKEVVGGYALFEVPSKQEMIDATVRFMELHRKHWPGWEGETEIREMAPMPAPAPTVGR